MTPTGLTALPYGDRAWLIECDADPVSVAQWLQGLAWPSPVEVNVGARTCLLRFSGAAPDRAAIDAVLAAAPTHRTDSGEQPIVVVIRVRYEGEDLASVADLTGLSPDDVVSLHTSATYRVAFLGFAPGFGYLTGLPSQLQLPRRSTPRIRVPAGAVAIADQYSAIYPRASPGGWHLLGASAQWLFDPERPSPSRLRAGMLVRFEAAS